MQVFPRGMARARRTAVSSVEVFRGRCALLVVGMVAGGPAIAQDAAAVRSLLERRVGGVAPLQVPAEDTDLPQPRLDDGSVDPRYATTPQKVRLGRLLFFDPVRSTDIRPEYGGIPETASTASCGCCHMGEAATKAAVVKSMGVGGEGRHSMDHRGTMRILREAREDVVDILPTALEQTDATGQVIRSGRFDSLDAPGRVAPSVIGFAYNTRLLWGGEAGEPNPEGYPAQEDVVRLASMAHRMASEDFSHLQDIPAYVELFSRAFPDEARQYGASGDLDDLVNLDTQFRAIASFLRTVITRDTPWDRFLAGDDAALTPVELRGAWLFAAPTEEGGANCIACHSGPALNKVLGDEEGALVEENFHNVGTVEHPLFALARETLADPAYFDTGRFGVTGDPGDLYEFKTPTLRQLRDAAPYFHGGQASTLREVVEYFNAGVPSDARAAMSGSLSALFTEPRGPGTRGLGLTREDIDSLVEFVGNGLTDDSLVHKVGGRRTFELTMEDLTYSGDLHTLGAVDGWLPSGLPNGFNDLVSREQLVFVRGNVNGDGEADLSDSTWILGFLFRGEEPPAPMVAGDVNDDGEVDLSDPIYLLMHLYRGGPPIPLPYPLPGQDLTR